MDRTMINLGSFLSIESLLSKYAIYFNNNE